MAASKKTVHALKRSRVKFHGCNIFNVNSENEFIVELGNGLTGILSGFYSESTFGKIAQGLAVDYTYNPDPELRDQFGRVEVFSKSEK